MKNAISIERERDEQIVRLQPLLRAESDATKRRESFETIQHISQGRLRSDAFHMPARTAFFARFEKQMQ